MNHACEPTLLPEEVVQLRGYFRIVFIALRHIYPGEELTFDYSAFLTLLQDMHIDHKRNYANRSTAEVAGGAASKQ